MTNVRIGPCGAAAVSSVAASMHARVASCSWSRRSASQSSVGTPSVMRTRTFLPPGGSGVSGRVSLELAVAARAARCPSACRLAGCRERRLFERAVLRGADEADRDVVAARGTGPSRPASCRASPRRR